MKILRLYTYLANFDSLSAQLNKAVINTALKLSQSMQVKKQIISNYQVSP